MNKAALMGPGTSAEWETPLSLFDPLYREFEFIVDVAATEANTRCTLWFEDAFAVEWAKALPTPFSVWCNPPYGRGIGRWLAKAAAERENGVTTVFLLPARTDTKWWHEHVWDASTHHPRTGVEVRFLQGRVKFEIDGKPAPAGSTFPSVLVIFRGV